MSLAESPAPRGRPQTPVTRDRIAAVHRGKRRPPDVCAKIARSHIGMTASQDTKARISAGKRYGHWLRRKARLETELRYIAIEAAKAMLK